MHNKVHQNVYIFLIQYLSDSFLSFRLEELNEKRSGVVQMVKLAEKERESLEVKFYSKNLSDLALTFNMNFGVFTFIPFVPPGCQE